MTTSRPFSPVDPTRSVGSLFFVGNATVLLRVAGLTLLTDPNFVPAGTSVPLGYGLSTTRLTEPAMTMDELPRLDAVILSHFHGDHFDQLAEERLDRHVPIVTTPEASKMLHERGFGQTLPLETWSGHDIHGPSGVVRVTALPGRHAPKPLDVPLPDVMGSLVEVWDTAGVGEGVAATPAPDQQPDLRLYITGDTIVYEGLREIPERVPGIDLALLHLGGTRVMGVTVTMDAEQGVELLQLVRPARAAAIHYDDYEAFKSPIEDFVAAIREARLEDSVRVLQRGETYPL